MYDGKEVLIGPIIIIMLYVYTKVWQIVIKFFHDLNISYAFLVLHQQMLHRPLSSQGKNVRVAPAKWRIVFSFLSLALISALSLSNTCVIAFFDVFAILLRGVWLF